MNSVASGPQRAFSSLLNSAIKTACSVLPEQGPIEVFIHHNTLHHFEDDSFHGAIDRAAKLLDASTYLSLTRYQDELAKGRIASANLANAIKDWWRIQEASQPWLTQYSTKGLDLVQQLLQVVRWNLSCAELNWMIAERLTVEEQQCYLELLSFLGQRGPASEIEELSNANSELDTLSHEWFVTICSAVLDRGIAFWSLSTKDRDILGACLRFTKERYPAVCTRNEFKNLWDSHNLEEVLENLVSLVIDPRKDSETFLLQELLTHPGWAAQFRGDLVRYLCARVWLKLVLRLAYNGRCIQVSKSRQFGQSQQSKAIEWAQVVATWKRPLQQKIDEVKVDGELWHFLLEHLDTKAKQRILHDAYEESFFSRALNVLQQAQSQAKGAQHQKDFFAIFCIDEREESMRRYLEQEAPECETYGFAGFFGVDVLYKAHPRAPILSLCPPVLSPKHLVSEEAVAPTLGRAMQVWVMRLERWIHEGSRSEIYLMPLVSLIGLLFLPIVFLRLQFPRLAMTLAARFMGVWNRPQQMKLRFKAHGKHSPDDPKTHELFSVEEMVAKTSTMIRVLRLHDRPPPLIYVVGHGATSVNNPHASAYNCGACGGHRGAVNARLFAQMANDPLVRKGLASIGLPIPDSTWFVAACHDTAADVIDFYDTEVIPKDLSATFAAIQIKFYSALKKNALERSRRFMSSACKTPSEAQAHVEMRAVDMREPRTECGHATNALTIIGTRALTRQIFFDRRAFLVSYDAVHDRDADILRGLLQAVIPVCSGISLEYFFSTMDPAKFGCGTKLPHNVAAMIGVMDGTASDLRTGLPTQMTEIHEPMRPLFIVEADEVTLRSALSRLPQMQKLLKGQWIHLCLFEKNTGILFRYSKDTFVAIAVDQEPVVRIKDGLSYSQSSRDHLLPAIVE